MTIDDYLRIPTDSSESLVSGGEVRLRKGAGRELKGGGAWIYDNEIDTVTGTYENGDILKILDFDGYCLGYGFLNDASTIRVRMLSRRESNVPSLIFLKNRVHAAWEYRKNIFRTETVSNPDLQTESDGHQGTDTLFYTGACLEDDSIQAESDRLLHTSFRIIFGEADFLPGLTVDKYEDILVVESLALGIDRLKTFLLAALIQVMAEDGVHVRGIYERSDAKVREKEGLPRVKGFVSEEFDTNVPITENGIRYLVDVKDGQKTGFFLDQKLNRLAIRPFCKGADVLDCFTHTGSFGLNAAAAGAAHVTSIDASALAIEQAKANARLNHFRIAGESDPAEDGAVPAESKESSPEPGFSAQALVSIENAAAWAPDGKVPCMEYLVGDVFDFLPAQRKAGKQYDVVILDPPAFTKSRSSVKAASAGYREINREGILLVKDGGYLATCSCSHFMTAELFRKAIEQAARDARRRLRQIEFRQQAPDHPILWASDASYYLKFYIFQVVEER